VRDGVTAGPGGAKDAPGEGKVKAGGESPFAKGAAGRRCLCRMSRLWSDPGFVEADRRRVRPH
jgi:hypothetical protein